jgi:hypothetical protein
MSIAARCWGELFAIACSSSEITVICAIIGGLGGLIQCINTAVRQLPIIASGDLISWAWRRIKWFFFINILPDSCLVIPNATFGAPRIYERLGFPQISGAFVVQFPIGKLIRNKLIFVELPV